MKQEKPTRKTFLRSVLVGFGVGAHTIKVKDLTPPKDDLVEELTRKVKEYEAKLAGKDEKIQELNENFKHFQTFSGYYTSSSYPVSLAINQHPLRKM